MSKKARWRYNLETDTVEPLAPPVEPVEPPVEPPGEQKPFEEMTDQEKIDELTKSLSEANKVIATLTGGDTTINITMNKKKGGGEGGKNPLIEVFERAKERRCQQQRR